MKRIYIILIIVLLVALTVDAQKKTKKSKKSKSSKSSTKKSAAVSTPPAGPAQGPSESVKLAEEMVALAQRLLKSVKAGQKPAPLCPNGSPKATCPKSPCSAWYCENISDAVCEEECHTCKPKFVRGMAKDDVTAFCNVKEITPQTQSQQSNSGATQTSTSTSTRRSSPPSSFPRMSSDGFPSFLFPGLGESGPSMNGPGNPFDMMMNFENMPPGLTPAQFFQHLQMQQGENQGSGSSNNNP